MSRGNPLMTSPVFPDLLTTHCVAPSFIPKGTILHHEHTLPTAEIISGKNAQAWFSIARRKYTKEKE